MAPEQFTENPNIRQPPVEDPGGSAPWTAFRLAHPRVGSSAAHRPATEIPLDRLKLFNVENR